MSETKNKITSVILTVLIILVLIGPIIFMFGADIYYNTAGKEKLFEYNNDDYYYVNVIVGSGRTQSFYFGAITKDEYNDWADGKIGTVWVNKLLKENYGNRINIDSITSIMIYDKDDLLPTGFFKGGLK